MDSFHFRAVWILSTRRLSVVGCVLRGGGFFPLERLSTQVSSLLRLLVVSGCMWSLVVACVCLLSFAVLDPLYGLMLADAAQLCELHMQIQVQDTDTGTGYRHGYRYRYRCMYIYKFRSSDHDTSTGTARGDGSGDAFSCRYRYRYIKRYRFRCRY